MSGSRLSLPTAHSDVPPVGVATIPTHSGGSTANVHPTYGQVNEESVLAPSGYDGAPAHTWFAPALTLSGGLHILISDGVGRN